jgi:cation diffusion facilitator family transporter
VPDRNINLKKGQKVAALSTLAILLLALSKGLIGYLSGSLALLADALHSSTDVLAIFASWFGLYLSGRKPSKRFPLGFYKAENLATLFISLLILYAAVELGIEGVKSLGRVPHIKIAYLALGIPLLSSPLYFFLAKWEKKIGKEISAQSLIANGQETMMHAAYSPIIFIAIAASYFQIRYVESIFTLVFAAGVFWIALKNGRIAIYGLMDAAVDTSLKNNVQNFLSQQDGIKKVNGLKMRQAGPFFFGQAIIQVKKAMDVSQGHLIADNAEEKIREHYPKISTFNIHVEPFKPKILTLMIPVKEDNGIHSKLSDHFGRSAYYAFVKLDKNQIKDISIIKNPFKGKEERAALAVQNHFIEERAPDGIITKAIGEIAFYALRSRFIDLFQAKAENVEENIKYFISSELQELSSFTHKEHKEVPLC